MGKYQAYPEYKDSGVDILGSIPTSWSMWKLNHFAPIITCGVAATPEYQDDGIAFLSAQNVKQRKIDLSKGFKFISKQKHEELIKNREPRNGDILLSRVGTVGEACIVNVDFPFSVFVSLTHLRLDNSICTNEFFVWLCESAYVKGMHGIVTLVGGGVGNLNVNDLREYKLPIPQIDEQKAIANFLDHETAKIDTLIEQQQQLIQLLKEKRQAVISHAVTKGLNPDAPMKDSGVEWLGEVPAHWEVVPLKLIIKTRKGVAFKSDDFVDEGTRVVKASDIKQLSINSSEVYLPKEFSAIYPKAVLNKGDIILSTVGSTPDVKNSAVGQIGMLPEHLDGSLLNQNTVVFELNSNSVNRMYLFYLLLSQAYRDHLDLNAHGTANQASLNIADMLAFTCPMPPKSEQDQIATMISETLERLERLEANAIDAIRLMQERRTALISAAVTGKIDVRNWQAPPTIITMHKGIYHV